ncbi:MAG: hypothetical protein AB8B91_24130 [Rubripirellula sp.]
MLHSSPSNTAGGPLTQDPLQAALGTQGSLLAPLAIDEPGVGHAGGVAGSLKAGVGNWNRGPLCSPRPRKQFKPRRQFKHPQFSLESPGIANVVVVGKGEKIREPVGSIAGKRSRLHPLPTARIKAITTNSRRPIGNLEARAIVAG